MTRLLWRTAWIILSLALLPAAAVIFGTGLLDDVFGLTPWQKLAGQFAASVLAVSLGARLTLPHLHPVLTGVLSVLWLLCCTNAVNRRFSASPIHC